MTVNRATVKFPLLMLLTFRLYLQIILIGVLIWTCTFSVIYFALELVNLNLNVKKDHMKFWGNFIAKLYDIYNKVSHKG